MLSAWRSAFYYKENCLQSLWTDLMELWYCHMSDKSTKGMLLDTHITEVMKCVISDIKAHQGLWWVKKCSWSFSQHHDWFFYLYCFLTNLFCTEQEEPQRFSKTDVMFLGDNIWCCLWCPYQDGACFFAMPSAAPFCVCMDVCLVFYMRHTFDQWPTISTGYWRCIYGQF